MVGLSPFQGGCFGPCGSTVLVSVGVGSVVGVGQAAWRARDPGKGKCAVTGVDSSVVLRVGMDGVVTRVPFAVDERGGAGTLFRDQIGCRLFDVISLDDCTDMWVDDEAIVGVDTCDREALAAATNLVATRIAYRFGRRQLVFGPVVITRLVGESAGALDEGQLAGLESLAKAAAFGLRDVLAARSGGAPAPVTIKVQSAYGDGHESERVETVKLSPFNELDELWEQLEQFTGDGHGSGSDVGYCYTVTVLSAPDHPELVGLSNEWVGA